jgi:hypothetical protein
MYLCPAAVFVFDEFLVGTGMFPGGVVFEHGVEDDEMSPHAGSNDNFWFFPLGGQSLCESTDHGITTSCRKSGHVEDVTDGASTTGDTTCAAVASAVVIERSQAHQPLG